MCNCWCLGVFVLEDVEECVPFGCGLAFGVSVYLGEEDGFVRRDDYFFS